MRLGDAHLQVFGQTSDDQFLGCIQVTPKYKTKRKGTLGPEKGSWDRAGLFCV